MNLPLPSSASPSSTSSRPSHSARLKRQLLACLDLIQPINESISTPPRRKRSGNEAGPPPPRWIELNEALVQLDKSIAALKEGEWDKLGVVVPILGRLSSPKRTFKCSEAQAHDLLVLPPFSSTLPPALPSSLSLHLLASVPAPQIEGVHSEPTQGPSQSSFSSSQAAGRIVASVGSKVNGRGELDVSFLLFDRFASTRLDFSPFPQSVILC